MRNRTKIIILVVLSAIELSCGSIGPVMTTTGEAATVQLRDGSKQSVELIAIDDSSILCSVAPGQKSSRPAPVQEIPLELISQIRVSGFRNDSWWTGVVLTEVLPAAGLAVAAGNVPSSDAGAVFAAALLPAVFTTVLYATSGVSTPTFEYPLSNQDLNELRKYARFGGKLTPTQKEQLLLTRNNNLVTP